ncbi:DUF560 domain-containing protein [Marinobacterium sp. D7]|uniref:surface lipoprotein assembly modifier n=1 Tax=Marinobacterium ramblicola TaxID=2849041 RepID=UPI001C2DA00C|nr:DUF560 domain-containing protein [Marinobacterium ramblicola]
MQATVFKGLILSLVVAAGPVSAQTSSEVERLTQLNQRGEFAKAYSLALEQRQQLEGLASFDLQYGIAAIDSGHPNEAIFAFERVLMAQPDHQAARLELARAYFLIGESARAEQLFHEVLALSPPSDVRARIEIFLARIETGRQRGAAMTQRSVSLRVGYDDNVNAGPDDASSLVLYDAYGNPYETSGVSSQGDRFTRLTGLLTHQRPLEGDWSWFANASADGRWHQDLHSLNNLSLDLATGVVWQQEDRAVRFRVNGQRYLLDAQTYRNLYGAAIEYQQALTRDISLGAFANWSRLEYGAGTRDSDMALAGLSARWRPDIIGKPLLQAAIYRGRETPRNEDAFTAGSAERSILGGYLGASWTLSTQLNLNTSVVFQHSDYAGPYYLLTPLTAGDREDRYTALLADLQWQLSPRTRAFTEYAWRDNDSNTMLLDYQRHQISLGVSYQF